MAFIDTYKPKLKPETTQGGSFLDTYSSTAKKTSSTTTVKKAVDSLAPALSKPKKTLFQKYTDIGEKGSNLAASFVTGLGQMTGGLIDQVLHVAEKALTSPVKNPLSPVAPIMAAIPEEKKKAVTDRIKQFREKYKTDLEAGVDIARETNPLSDTFAGQTAEVIGGIVPNVGLALAGSPALLLSVSESFMNAEDSFDENVKNGMSKEDAMKRAVPQMSADLLATYFTNKLGALGKFAGEKKALINFGKKTVGKVTSRILESAKDASLEVGQEVIQTGLQNLATDKPFTQGMSDTAKIMIIPSLLFGGGANLYQSGKMTDDELKAETQKELDTIQQKMASGEKLTEDESAFFVATGGTNPFAETVPGQNTNIPKDEAVLQKELATIAAKASKMTPLAQEYTEDQALAEEDPLMGEAKKYGSEEEFVASQKPVYRGVQKDVNDFSPSERGAFKEYGFSVAEDKKIAKRYGDKVIEGYISPSAKVKIEPDEFGEGVGYMLNIEKVQKAKAEGYDAYTFKNKDGEIETLVFNPKTVQTKSQLSDVYKKSKAVKSEKTIVKSTQKGREAAVIEPVIPPTEKATEGDTKSKRFQTLVKRMNEEQRARLEQEGVQRDDPAYMRVNMEEDAKRALDFVNEHPDIARRVAEGKELPPEGILREHIASSLLAKYLQEGDMKSFSTLAVAQTMRGTRYGQEIASFRGTNDPSNPTYWIDRVLQGRMNQGMKDLSYIYEKANGAKNEKTKARKRIDSNARVIRERLREDKMKVEEADALLNSLIC